MKVNNPVLKGFNPDPCMVKANGSYFIAVSSFEWLPGVRVYESKDLVNFHHRTDILTHEVKLQGNPKNCSIWAPQLSFYEGMFYLIYTDVKSTKSPFKDCHNYLITSESIDGPWSEPIYLNSSGFDPSLFHDEDGRKWLLNEIWDYRMDTPNKSSGIVIQEYDDKKKKLIGKSIKIFDGTELSKTEAPHIYKRNGYYYMITAEGGTGSGHSVTVLRSKNITGPYELDPKYPMLTSRNNPFLNLQCAGHASLVEDDNGDLYIAHLCTRPVNGKHAILGRETAIQEVIFDEDGWLRLKHGGNEPFDFYNVNSDVEIEDKESLFEDNFSGETLDKNWNTLRIMKDESWCSLKKREGFLRITSGESLQSLFNQHMIAIRQRDFSFRAETALEFKPDSYLQMAGLVLYLNEDNYLYSYVTYEEGKGKVIKQFKCVEGVFTLNDLCINVGEEDKVKLLFKSQVNGDKGQYYYAINDGEYNELGDIVDITFLSGGFTGNFIGICVQDMNMYQGTYADFEYFKYMGLN